VNIGDPDQNFGTVETLLDQAQATPHGRARTALSAAVADIPG